MKKARIALSAIAILAVVGGAFAFKAARTANIFYSNGTTLIGGVTRTLGTVSFTTTYTTEILDGVVPTTKLWTTTPLTTTSIAVPITVYSTL
jgi:hypothetical protein